MREQAEKRATKEAMQQSHAWLSGASISRMAEETPEELSKRIHQAAKHANDLYNVSGLCRKFSGRLSELVNVTAGDRLSH